MPLSPTEKIIRNARERLRLGPSKAELSESLRIRRETITDNFLRFIANTAVFEEIALAEEGPYSDAIDRKTVHKIFRGTHIGTFVTASAIDTRAIVAFPYINTGPLIEDRRDSYPSMPHPRARHKIPLDSPIVDLSYGFTVREFSSVAPSYQRVVTNFHYNTQSTRMNAGDIDFAEFLADVSNLKDATLHHVEAT